MGTFLTLLLIQFIVINIIDISGFIEDGLTPFLKRLAGTKVGKLGKPWVCSYCMLHWIGLIYLIIAGELSLLTYGYLLLLCFFNPIMLSIIYMIRDFIEKLIETICDYFCIR